MGWGQDKMQEAFSVGMNRTQTRMREGHTGLQVSSWEVVEVEMGWMVDEKEKSSKVACIVKARMSFACHLFTTGGPQS